VPKSVPDLDFGIGVILRRWRLVGVWEL